MGEVKLIDVDVQLSPTDILDLSLDILPHLSSYQAKNNSFSKK